MISSVSNLNTIDACKLSQMSTHFLKQFNRGVQFNWKALDSELPFSVALSNFLPVASLVEFSISGWFIKPNGGGSLASAACYRQKVLPVSIKDASKKRSTCFPVRLNVEATSMLQTALYYASFFAEITMYFLGAEPNRHPIGLQHSDGILQIGELRINVALDPQGVGTRLLGHQVVVAFLCRSVGAFHRVDGPPCSKDCKKTANQCLEVEYHIAPRVAADRSLHDAWSSKDCGRHDSCDQNDQNEDLQGVVTAHEATFRAIVYCNHGIICTPILQGRAK